MRAADQLPGPPPDGAKPPPDAHRASFEVASWNGARWVVEGSFETAAEAATEAKQVLSRKLGVRVTEEAFNPLEGVFKSRILFTEIRQQAKPERRAAGEAAVAAARPRPNPAAARNADAALHVAIASLIVALAAMLFSLAR